MILFRTALIFSALFVCNSMLAQNQDKAVKAVINRFFEGMAKGDTALLKSACTDQPLLQTYMADEDGQLKVFTEDFGEFVRFVGLPARINTSNKSNLTPFRRKNPSPACGRLTSSISMGKWCIAARMPFNWSKRAKAGKFNISSIPDGKTAVNNSEFYTFVHGKPGLWVCPIPELN